MLRNAFTYLIAHGVPAVLGFSAIVLFTRLLSPEQYGYYVVAMSLAGIVNAVLFAWVRLSILRYQSEGKGTDIRMSALAGYGLSAALSPLILLGFMLLTDSPPEQLLFASLVALAMGLFEFGQETLRAEQQARAYMRISMLRSVLTFSLSLLCVWLGWGGLGLLAGIGCAYLFSFIVSSPVVWRRPVRKFDGATFRRMLVFGAPMALSGAVFSLHGALDRLIVVHFLGEATAGRYGASADMVRQIVLLPAMAIGAGMVPAVIRSLSEEGEAKANSNLELTFEMLMAVLVPSVIGLALVAPAFSSVMLGPEFRDVAAMLIPILAFAWLFQALTHQYIHASFHLAGKARFLLLQGIIILAANVLASIALIPRFGLQGAAWALVIAEVAGVLAGFFLAGRAYPLPRVDSRIVRVLAAGAAMALPTYLVRGLFGQPVTDLAVSVVVGVVSYAVAALVLDLVGVRTALMRRLNVPQPDAAG